MKKSRYTEEQIIGFLKHAQAGMPVKELRRKGGFSHASFYMWRAKFGGMDVSDARRLRELEGENAKLKRLLAEASAQQHWTHPFGAARRAASPARWRCRSTAADNHRDQLALQPRTPTLRLVWLKGAGQHGRSLER